MTDIHWIIIVSSMVLMLLAVGYIAIVMLANQRVLSEQLSKYNEIKKREERYKALFNNTVVGMVHFTPVEWKVIEANQTLLSILEINDHGQLQTEFPAMMKNVEAKITDELTSFNSFSDCTIDYTTHSGKEMILLFSGRKDRFDDSIHSVIIDITTKKRLEESNIRAQKMEALSVLTSSIVHDLQNIFAPLRLSLKLLEQNYRSARVKKILKATRSSVNDGQRLVNNILSIAKNGKKEFRPVNINNLMRSVLQSHKTKKHIDIRFNNAIRFKDVEVNGNENQLKQMFLNILRNSTEAIGKKGRIDIDVQSTEELVRIVINDTGAGISEKDLPKVFEPFYSTKMESGGTGLGLAMVAEIAKRHSGVVLIESSMQKGTTLSVSLPIFKNKQQ